MFLSIRLASLHPVALMRLTEIDDPKDLLKNHKESDIIIEEKLDGWKIQAYKDDGKVHIFSRRGEEVTEKFPSLVKALNLPEGCFVEGEIVYWEGKKQDIGKVTSVAGSGVENALKKQKELKGQFKIHLYDLLWYKGKDVSDKPFSARRKLLESIIKSTELIKITKQYPFSKWQEAMKIAVETGGEGIVLKLKEKPYTYKAKGETEPKPSNTMFKYKKGIGKSETDDFVVYDYTVTEKGNLKAKYGQYHNGKLYHVSEIANFSSANEEEIKKRLKKGNFVIEIGFQEKQPGGLRHQKFIRFRDDKAVKDCKLSGVHLQNVDKFELAKKAFLISKLAGRETDIFMKDYYSTGLVKDKAEKLGLLIPYDYTWPKEVYWKKSIDEIYNQLLNLCFVQYNKHNYGGEKISFEEFKNTRFQPEFMKPIIEKLKLFVLNDLPKEQQKIETERTTNRIREDKIKNKILEEKKEQDKLLSGPRTKFQKEYSYNSPFYSLNDPFKYQIFIFSGVRDLSFFSPKKFREPFKHEHETVSYRREKPISGFWTSTLIKDGDKLSSDWLNWAQLNLPTAVGQKGIIFKVKDNAKVYHIADEEDFEKLYEMFNIDNMLDWDAISKYFDGVHASDSGIYSIEAWDVESTIWFNTSALQPITFAELKIEMGKEQDPLDEENSREVIENINLVPYKELEASFYMSKRAKLESGDTEKASEVLIDQGSIKLTRGQIVAHYTKSDIRKKIMNRIKGKPVLLYLGTSKNKNILKRNHNGKPIVITDDNPKNDENPNNYFYWVSRRMLSIHEVFGTKTNIGFVDLDLHGSFSLDKARKYAKALINKLKSELKVSPIVYQSGGTGLHIEFKLKQSEDIDKLRNKLKELLNDLNKDWEGVTTGLVKGNGMRSDVSTLHNKGSLRVPGSLGEKYGKEKKTKIALSIRELIKIARHGVKEEYVWIWSKDGKFVTEPSNKFDHYYLAQEKNIPLNDIEYRGFVTIYTDGRKEVDTYDISFFDMPTRLQDRVETFFELIPGKYKTNILSLGRGFGEAMQKEKEKNIELEAATNPLSTYEKKRDFEETPEPEPKVEKTNKYRFVIQLHHADRAGDHYDLRLENDKGAMSSWAIPKHKLPKGKERLLAMKTEDHPISYNKFHGTIPKGEYGAGTVEIHDSGTYEELQSKNTKIVFKLKGKKEKGTYKLFKTQGNKWMIMEGE